MCGKMFESCPTFATRSSACLRSSVIVFDAVISTPAFLFEFGFSPPGFVPPLLCHYLRPDDEWHHPNPSSALSRSKGLICTFCQSSGGHGSIFGVQLILIPI